MTFTTIMAAALDAELQARGIFSIGRADCEAIIHRVLEHTAEAASSRLQAAKGVDDNSGLSG